MDINQILHLIPAQIEKIIGVLAALFLLTTIWLLIRSLKEGSSSDANSSDLSSIEDALKRVLNQTSITTRPASLDELASAGPARSGADGSPEKDLQIAELRAALERAQVLLNQNTTKSADGAATSVGHQDAKDPALVAQVDELKARLAEYEIIEDDIADLALYREENARLKIELDNLKVSASTEIAATEVEMAKAMAAASTQTSEPTGIPDPGGAIDSLEVAEVTQVTDVTEVNEDALANAMVAEAIAIATNAETQAKEALSENADESIDVLSDLLDPDKLIEEVNAFESEDLMSEFKAEGQVADVKTEATAEAKTEEKKS